jgi:hypothetical protein
VFGLRGQIFCKWLFSIIAIDYDDIDHAVSNKRDHNDQSYVCVCMYIFILVERGGMFKR